MFGTLLISMTTLIHLYVFMRAATVPLIERVIPRPLFIGAGIVLWMMFYLGRTWGHHGTGVFATAMESAGMAWMATVFLIFIPVVTVDVITLFGCLAPKLAPTLRFQAIAAGVLMAGVALVQGLRPPVVTHMEILLPGLPAELEGSTLVAVSDMHLGSQLGPEWLEALVARINGLKPDGVLFLGDIFEGHGTPDNALTHPFRKINAPLGSWGVLGNHEFYGRGSTASYRKAGIRLLRNAWEQAAPGLIFVGVDDLTILSRLKGRLADAVVQASANRPDGAAILLSHTPLGIETASASGIDLMLSGHTHGGQIWPFDLLIKRRFPMIEGCYKSSSMTVIVSRGAGTWGPRMRLWKPGEILHITLKSRSDGLN